MTFATLGGDVVGGHAPVFIPLWVWPVFLVFVATALAVDLKLHRTAHVASTRSSLLQTALWISLGLFVWQVIRLGFGPEAGKQYIAGYVIEKSLSFDNVFVWALIFKAFQLGRKYQHRVLFWGIFGALALRALFILVGLALISWFHVVIFLMGGFLLWTAYRVGFGHEEFNPEKSRALQLFKRWFRTIEYQDLTEEELEKQKLFVFRNAKRFATPLMVVLTVIEASDVVFAFDSVPAILAVSNQQFVVFASNAMAIMGLRSMYFLLADLQDRFEYLDKGLSFILAFVGIKMVAGYFEHHIDTWWSLGVIMTILLVAIIASQVKHVRVRLSSDLHVITEET